MNKSRLAYFQEKLTAEKALLEDELKSIAHQNPSGDWEATPLPASNESLGDDGDQASAVEDFESKIARLNSLETRYEQVVNAIDRIQNGTYGVCLKSGKPIEEDRLEANPAAETCKAMMNN